MSLLVCVVPVAPVRAGAAHTSEQTTQLLFGELCELLEQTKDFSRIRAINDDYEGWCQSTQLTGTDRTFADPQNTLLAGDWLNNISIHNQAMQVPFGSSLGFLENGKGTIGKYEVLYEGATFNPTDNAADELSLKRYAYKFLNTSYLWGGRSVFGVDCSGFTQMIFRCFGVPLARDAYQQATQGEAVGFLQEVRCGDLAFFDNEAGKITHVGMLLDGETIIHSSGKVRIDTIDSLGIVNRDTSKRTHNLRIIKRMLEHA
jgi:cell wall-associated NlpC family hydrolase